MPLTITPHTITIPQIKHCLSLYPKVVEKHYNAKIKDPKKASEALKRDTWRYEELPASLVGQDEKEQGIGMTLDQLERLVQWKM